MVPLLKEKGDNWREKKQAMGRTAGENIFTHRIILLVKNKRNPPVVPLLKEKGDSRREKKQATGRTASENIFTHRIILLDKNKRNPPVVPLLKKKGDSRRGKWVTGICAWNKIFSRKHFPYGHHLGFTQGLSPFEKGDHRGIDQINISHRPSPNHK